MKRNRLTPEQLKNDTTMGVDGLLARTNLHVVDIIADPDPHVIKEVEKELEFFKKNDDFTVPTRVPQYKNLKIDEFEAFTVLMDDENFVAFSGCYTEPWFPPGSIRTGSRLWLSLNYRQVQTIHFYKNSTWNPGSQHILPIQQEIVKKLGYKYSFWTREYPHRRKMFLKINEYCNRYSRFHHTALNNVYNVCPPVGKKKTVNADMPCWQNLSITNLTEAQWWPPLEAHYNLDFEFDLPNITLEEYKKKYRN